MTATLTLPRGKYQGGSPGGVVLILFNLQIPQFFLGFNIVTMIVN